MPILRQLCIGDGIIKDVMCVMVDETNTSTFDITLIQINISTKNDNRTDPVLQSPYQTYDKTLVEAAGILIDPIITENGGLQEQSKNLSKHANVGLNLSFNVVTRTVPLIQRIVNHKPTSEGVVQKIVSKGLIRMLKKQDNKTDENLSKPVSCIESDDKESDMDTVPVPGPIAVLDIPNANKEMNNLEIASTKSKSTNENDPN